MKKTLFFLLSIIGFTTVFSQSKGYYNQKNYVMVSSSMYFPIIRLITSPARYYNSPYKLENNNLTYKRTLFRNDYQVSYMRTITKRTALGFDFGFASIYSQRPNVRIENSMDINYIMFERNRLNVINITPKIEYSNTNGVYPIGITHQVGFGLNFASIVDKKYSAQPTKDIYNESTYNPIVIPESSKIKPEDNLLMFINMYYGVSLKVPITKNFFFNAGMRFNLTLYPHKIGGNDKSFKNSSVYPLDEALDFHKKDFQRSVRIATRNNIVNMNLGFGYTF